MFTKINITYVIIVILIVIIIIQRSCSTNISDCPECDTFDTTAFITSLPIVYADTQYVPVHINIDRWHRGKDSIIEVPSNIDSLKVAQAYFTKWILQDTILNDTNGLIVINDVLWMNKIISRNISPKEIYPHYKIITKTIHKQYVPRFKVYVGFGLGGWVNQFGVSGKVLFQTKKEHIYGLSFDPINKIAEGSMYWKIKLRK